jgi:hypothetical protein
MGFPLKDFIRLRPYVYHLTSRENLRRLKRTGRMECAAGLILRSDRPELLRERRVKHEPLLIEGETAWLRDQLPLKKGCIDFEVGWDLARLVEHINRRVFFWPGWADGFSDYGFRHLGRYFDEGPALLRIPLDKLVKANEGNPPRLCAFNSGSPRVVGGKKSPRGSKTFVTAEEFPRKCGDVVEVTFEGGVILPDETEARFVTVTPWGPILEEEAKPEEPERKSNEQRRDASGAEGVPVG